MEMHLDFRRRCEWCNAIIPDNAQARRTFCCKRCANAYFNALTAQARAEERAKLKCERCGGPIVNAIKLDTSYCENCRERPHLKQCQQCDKPFRTGDPKQRFCCRSCAGKSRRCARMGLRREAVG